MPPGQKFDSFAAFVSPMTHVANEVMIGLVLGFGFLASLVAIVGPPAAQQQPAQQAQESPPTIPLDCRELRRDSPFIANELTATIGIGLRSGWTLIRRVAS